MRVRVPWLLIVGVVAIAAGIWLQHRSTVRAVGERDVALGRERAALQTERAARRQAERALAAEKGARATLLSEHRPGDLEALRLGLQAVSLAMEAGDPAGTAELVDLLPPAVLGLTTAVQVRSYPRFPAWTHERPIRFARFSPDGSTVLMASEDGERRLWDVKTGRERTRSQMPRIGVLDIAVSADGSRMVTGNEQGAWLRDAKTGDLLAELVNSGPEVDRVEFTPDDRRVITYHRDGTIRLFGAASQGSAGPALGTLITAIPCKWEEACEVGLSPDGTRIAWAGDDRIVQIRDLKTGAVLRRPTGHTDRITSLRFSPDGRHLLTTSDDGTARLVLVQGSAVSGAVFTLQGHVGRIHEAAFSPDGTRIATASEDRTARLWDAKDGSHRAALDGHTDGVVSVAFSPDGTRLLTTSRDHTARLWDATAGIISSIAPLATLPKPSDEFTRATFSADGAYVLVYDPSGALLFDVRDPSDHDADAGGSITPTELGGHGSSIQTAAFSPDGTRLVTGSQDGLARLWEVKAIPDARPGATLLATLRGHTDALADAVFSPDGLRLVTTSFDGTARLWDVQGAQVTRGAEPGACLLILRGHTATVSEAMFSPDGRRLVTISADKTARLWDVATGALLSTWRGHQGAILTAAFSPDGHRVLTGSYDGTAQLWSVPERPAFPEAPGPASQETGAALLTLQGLDRYGAVTRVGFSADGAVLLTAGLYRPVQRWAAATGALLSNLEVEDNRTSEFEFSPDGRLVLTTTGWRFGEVNLWDTGTGARRGTYKLDRVIESFRLTASGTRLLTASSTGQLWDTRTGELLVRFTDPRLVYARIVALSPDGAHVLLSHRFGEPLLFSARLSTYAARACELLAGHPAALQPVAELCRPERIARLNRPM